NPAYSDSSLRVDLRKQSRLDLLGYLQFLCRPPLGFQLLSDRPSLFFHTTRQLIETRQTERVSIHIFKPCKYPAPLRLMGWRLEAHSTLAPLAVLGRHIFCNEIDVRIPAN